MRDDSPVRQVADAQRAFMVDNNNVSTYCRKDSQAPSPKSIGRVRHWSSPRTVPRQAVELDRARVSREVVMLPKAEDAPHASDILSVHQHLPPANLIQSLYKDYKATNYRRERNYILQIRIVYSTLTPAACSVPPI